MKRPHFIRISFYWFYWQLRTQFLGRFRAIIFTFPLISVIPYHFFSYCRVTFFWSGDEVTTLNSYFILLVLLATTNTIIGTFPCCYCHISIDLHDSVSFFLLLPFSQRHVYSFFWSGDQFCAWPHTIKGLRGLDAKLAQDVSQNKFFFENSESLTLKNKRKGKIIQKSGTN